MHNHFSGPCAAWIPPQLIFMESFNLNNQRKLGLRNHFVLSCLFFLFSSSENQNSLIWPFFKVWIHNYINRAYLPTCGIFLKSLSECEPARRVSSLKSIHIKLLQGGWILPSPKTSSMLRSLVTPNVIYIFENLSAAIMTPSVTQALQRGWLCKVAPGLLPLLPGSGHRQPCRVWLAWLAPLLPGCRQPCQAWPGGEKQCGNDPVSAAGCSGGQCQAGNKQLQAGEAAALLRPSPGLPSRTRRTNFMYCRVLKETSTGPYRSCAALLAIPWKSLSE